MEKTIVNKRKFGPEFEEATADILDHPYFQCLKSYIHHGKRRYDHSVLVAYNTFVIAKKLGRDAQTAARGALLHDFFFDKTKDQKQELRKNQRGLKKVTTMQGFAHPETARGNAVKYFDISAKEQDMIEKHMFPLTPIPPKHIESWILTTVDKGVALKELIGTLCKHPIKTCTGRMNQQEGYVFAHNEG